LIANGELGKPVAPIISRLDHEQCKRLDSVPVRKAYIAKLFLAEETRNTWGRVFSYEVPSLDFDECSRDVEDRRTNGSAWRIREAPALALSGPTITLVALLPARTPPTALFRPMLAARGTSPDFHLTDSATRSPNNGRSDRV
jgi:hypothetical protein